MEDPTRVPLAVDPVRKRMKGTTIHGNKSFDVPYISEISAGLWQGGCHQGLVLPEFIDHLVSLYPWERYEVRYQLQTALTVKMYDSTDQGLQQVDDIAHWVTSVRKEGGNVLVHCQAGLNRSSLVVARVLMIAGMSADEAIRTVREARSEACLCNPAFEAWLRAFDA